MWDKRALGKRVFLWNCISCSGALQAFGKWYPAASHDFYDDDDVNDTGMQLFLDLEKGSAQTK
jgi:hypothetical protein